MWTKLTIVVINFIAIGWAASASNYVVTWEDTDLRSSRPLLGERMCTRGPQYWCHNITQAKECHAVKHCIKKVWEHTKLPEDNDSVCQVCKEMVKEARDQLLSNETQDEIRQVFEGSCNLLPIKLVAKECRELADQFIPELVDTLASRMDPQVVCAVSGLCNSVRIDEMLGEMKEIPSKKQKFDLSTDSCPKCNYFIGKAVSHVKSLEKTDLKNKILALCGELGSYSDSCKLGVLEEFESIYDHVQNKIHADELCGLIGLCQVSTLHRVSIGHSLTSVKIWTPQQPVNDDLPCDFCKQLVVYGRNWLIANTTKEEFQEIVEGLCKQTGKFQDECLNLAKQYGRPLYQLLVDEMDPENVCARIGVCISSLGKTRYTLLSNAAPISTILVAQTKAKDVSEDLPMMKLLPGDKFAGDDELNPVKSSAVCQLCEYALHSLQNYLGTPATEEEIKEAVDKLCDDILPQEMASQCKDFVKDYGDSLIVLLAQQVDPSQVCPKLGACKTSTSDPMIPITPTITPNDKKIKDLPTCPLCHFAVSKLIDMIGKNMTTEAIDNAMEHVCYVLPHSIRDDCLNFMKNYGDRIAEMIIIEGTSEEICAVLHLCILAEKTVTGGANALPFERYFPSSILNGEISKVEQQYPILKNNIISAVHRELSRIRLTNSNSQGNQVHEPVESKQSCIMCEFVITRLDTMLQNNATEEEIKETVEKICDYLPKTVRDSCQGFVDQYGDMVISYLVHSLDPAQICAELKLCDDTSVSGAVKAQVEDLKMDNCELCVEIADYLSTMLDDPKVEQSIDKVVERICPILPSKYHDECKTMIEDYGPYLMSIMAQEADKGRACSLVNICPTQQPILN